MEYNIEYYYQQKRKKKKINKIKVGLAIIVIFGIILLGGNQILKSNNSPIYDLDTNQEEDVNNNVDNNENNEDVISVIIDKPKENIIENKEEISNVNDKTNNDKTNNENQTENQVENKVDNPVDDIEQNEDWKTAEDDYFKDAVFIGNSRTEGFILNNGLTSKVTSYTHKGLTVDTIFTDKVINMNGKKLAIMEALKETRFPKVYIMLGINETGWVYSNIFINKYAKIIDEIKKINPQCAIYIQSIIPVTEKVSREHQYINNSKIEEYNSLIKKMAEEKDIYYLNVQESVINQNGALPEDAATDGIHLNRKYCEKWFEYLKEHTIGE